MELVRIGCACLIGLVFAVSAVSKLRDFDGFARSVPALVPACAGAQRLALARAFVRDGRDLLILDEPSSGLDRVFAGEGRGRRNELRISGKPAGRGRARPSGGVERLAVSVVRRAPGSAHRLDHAQGATGRRCP
ncbi:hypothetical protein AB0H37_43100 [Actinomadura sp. NPDC023710]|uniref:hypothetical protein n=1 Tax=Actinomadura sp. NPDC023710 TaxID=3158219 RepID=UPI0033E75B31